MGRGGRGNVVRGGGSRCEVLRAEGRELFGIDRGGVLLAGAGCRTQDDVVVDA